MYFAGRHCIRFVGLRNVLLLALMCILTVQYVIVMSFDLPFSRLYTHFHTKTELRKQGEEFNAKRLQQAEEYFSNINAKESKTFYKQMLLSGTADLLICIVNTKRSSRDTGYLLQTAAHIDRLVKTDKYFTKKFVFVCNVDKAPAENKDFEFLTEYLMYAKKFGSSSFPFNITAKSNRTSVEEEVQKKEQEDYVFCLNVSYSLNPAFILVLEDDVVPITNMLQVLHFTLKQRLLHDGILQTRNFSFIKLYYPEKWQGFAYQTDRVIELLCYGAVGGGCFVGMCLLLNSYAYRKQLFLFLVGLTLTLFSVSVIGRQNVMAMRHLSPHLYWLGPSSHCCVPAMLYHRDILPGLTNYLLTNLTVNKDIVLHDYMESTGIPGFMLEPNLFRHTGMYSSRHSQPKEPEEFQFQLP